MNNRTSIELVRFSDSITNHNMMMSSSRIQSKTFPNPNSAALRVQFAVNEKSSTHRADKQILLKEKFDILSEIAILSAENNILKEELGKRERLNEKDEIENLKLQKQLSMDNSENLLEKERLFKTKRQISQMQKEDDELDSEISYLKSYHTERQEKHLKSDIQFQNFEYSQLLKEIDQITNSCQNVKDEIDGPMEQHKQNYISSIC